MGGVVSGIGDVIGGAANAVGSVVNPISSIAGQIPGIGPIAGPAAGFITGGPLGGLSSIAGQAIQGNYGGGGGSNPSGSNATIGNPNQGGYGPRPIQGQMGQYGNPNMGQGMGQRTPETAAQEAAEQAARQSGQPIPNAQPGQAKGPGQNPFANMPATPQTTPAQNAQGQYLGPNGQPMNGAKGPIQGQQGNPNQAKGPMQGQQGIPPGLSQYTQTGQPSQGLSGINQAKGPGGGSGIMGARTGPVDLNPAQRQQQIAQYNAMTPQQRSRVMQ
jgi:hypothetical protein